MPGIEEKGRIFLNDNGNVEIYTPNMKDVFEFPPDIAVKMACLMMQIAGCRIRIDGYKIFADASRVSARSPNTDAGRRLDA